MEAYLRTAQDPDRGYALAALTDGLALSLPLRRTLGELLEGRVDPFLFRLSRDYVGDTAETVALLWPAPEEGAGDPPSLGDVVAAIATADRAGRTRLLASLLDRLDVTGRWAFLKLLTGALRVGVSARLAKTALARLGGRPVEEIEEVWHGLSAPYAALFAWLEGRGPRPDSSGGPVFRSPMLAHPIDQATLASLDIADYAAEWKWDGIRVQLVSAQGATRLFSRNGEDIGHAFPEIVQDFRHEAALDGELVVMRDGEVASFNDLQQRLNRKAVTKAILARHPAHLRLYDALLIGPEDLRSLPFHERRRRLEAWHAAAHPPRIDLSAIVPVATSGELTALWRGTRAAGIEGLMLKRRDSPYVAGRPIGQWWKLKREPLVADCVLMYAVRGSGKRSSYYSDYTFGVWRETSDGGQELVPVGKAYFGFTDEEMRALDRFIRECTVERFGPVRAVAPGLVLEVAFDAVNRSARHKSGLAMRFPRIHRIRWEKPAAEAERLETLLAMIEGAERRG
jgi:DNA ligase-1